MNLNMALMLAKLASNSTVLDLSRSMGMWQILMYRWHLCACTVLMEQCKVSQCRQVHSMTLQSPCSTS